MAKALPKLLFPITLFFIFPSVLFAQVENVVFTTDPQTIKPNILSEAITIQTQDSGGSSFQTPETMDIQFLSTSGSGEFLNSSGQPATTYMSKNTANKTFYYRDSAEGAFTITVNARGRDTGIELSASQQITVSSGASQNSSQNTFGEVLGALDTSKSASTQYIGSGSTDKVSSLNSKLEIVAGQDRTTAPGSPIWFQAAIKKNTTGAGLELGWSFGDGNVGVGPLVSHSYKYPGDYTVVLSARSGDIFSVSRLKVRVVESSITVADKVGYLEISNNSNNEINLFNWKIENAGRGFVFQPNTIVSPKSSLKLDKTLLTMKGYENSRDIRLKNYLGEEVFAMAPAPQVDLGEVSKKLADVKNEALAIQSKIPKYQTAVVVSEAEEEVAGASDLSDEANTTENIIYEIPKERGVISRAWQFLVSVLR